MLGFDPAREPGGDPAPGRACVRRRPRPVRPPVRARQPPLLRGSLPGAGAREEGADRLAPRARQAERAGAAAGRDVLARHAAAAAHRARAPARPRGAVPRRAHDRARPVGAREVRETVAGLREQGKTVLLTTHYMYEADELCRRVAVIAGGRIVAEGHAGRAQGARPRPHVIEIETFGALGSGLDRLRALSGVISVATEHTRPGGGDPRPVERRLRVDARPAARARRHHASAR